MISRIRPHAVVSLCLSISIVASLAAHSTDASKSVDTASKVDDFLGALKGTGAKVILVNVWSATCAPCLSELQILGRVALKHKDNAALGFIGLCLFGSEGESQTDALASASEAVRMKKVTYRNLLWTGKGELLYDRFKIMGTPYTVFMSADGIVLGDVELPEDPEKVVEVIERGIEKALIASVKK